MNVSLYFIEVDSAAAPLRDQWTRLGDLSVCCMCEFSDINKTRRSVFSGGTDIISRIIKAPGTSRGSFLDSRGDAARGAGIYLQQFSSRCY